MPPPDFAPRGFIQRRIVFPLVIGIALALSEAGIWWERINFPPGLSPRWVQCQTERKGPYTRRTAFELAAKWNASAANRGCGPHVVIGRYRRGLDRLRWKIGTAVGNWIKGDQGR